MGNKLQKRAVDVLPVAIVLGIVATSQLDNNLGGLVALVTCMAFIGYCMVVYSYALSKGRDIATRRNAQK